MRRGVYPCQTAGIPRVQQSRATKKRSGNFDTDVHHWEPSRLQRWTNKMMMMMIFLFLRVCLLRDIMFGMYHQVLAVMAVQQPQFLGKG